MDLYKINMKTICRFNLVVFKTSKVSSAAFIIDL